MIQEDIQDEISQESQKQDLEYLREVNSIKVWYLTDYIASLIEDGFTYDFDIKVVVNSQDETQAIIIKEKGQDVKSSLLY